MYDYDMICMHVSRKGLIHFNFGGATIQLRKIHVDMAEIDENHHGRICRIISVRRYRQ